MSSNASRPSPALWPSAILSRASGYGLVNCTIFYSSNSTCIVVQVCDVWRCEALYMYAPLVAHDQRQIRGSTRTVASVLNVREAIIA